MKPSLKRSLIAAAVVDSAAFIRLAQTELDMPLTALPAVATVRPGVTSEVVTVTYFSSDVRCAARRMSVPSPGAGGVEVQPSRFPVRQSPGPAAAATDPDGKPSFRKSDGQPDSGQNRNG
jgi:hypothetical protein